MESPLQNPPDVIPRANAPIEFDGSSFLAPPFETHDCQAPARVGPPKIMFQLKCAMHSAVTNGGSRVVRYQKDAHAPVLVEARP
jgi:hypothetical protein